MPDSVSHDQLVKQSLPSGSEGRPVELLSNFFKINTSGTTVYQYAIELKKVVFKTSDKDSGNISEYQIAPVQKGLEMFIKKASSEIIDQYFKQNSQAFFDNSFVHDGSQKVFSTYELNLSNVADVQTFNIGKRPTRFLIILTLTSLVDLKELENYYKDGSNARTISPSIVPVYEQVFRSVIEKKYTPHQSSFYCLEKRERTASEAFQFVHGFSISVRMTEFGLALNLHLKSSCLIAENILTVYQFLAIFLGRTDLHTCLSKEEIKRASKLLSGLKVQTTHTGVLRVFTIDGVSSWTTVTHTFTKDDGTVSTEQDYFKKQYGKSVLPLNLIQTMTPFRKDCPKTKIKLPMELCFLVKDQFVAEYKLPTSVQMDLLKMSSLAPNVYFPQVVNFVKVVSKIDLSIFDSFGIDLTTLPVKFPARVLPLPKILNNNHNFLIPANTPAKWAVICFDPTVKKEELSSFITKLTREAERKRMPFETPSPVTSVEIENPVTIENCLINLKNLKHAEFVVIVLPSGKFIFVYILFYSWLLFVCLGNTKFDKNAVYTEIKFCENNDENIVTQCVLGEKVIDTPHGYFDNLLDKINAKLGGTVSVYKVFISKIIDFVYFAQNTHVGHDYIEDLPLRLDETMLVGMDVNHPGPIEKVAISIAAVCGTYDKNFCLYSNDISLQLKARTETITQVGDMMKKLLEHYRDHNGGRYPKSVIIFRDGVGDGHLKVIQEAELIPVEETLRQLAHPVKMAFFVVQKRHIVRFALTTQNTMGRKPTYNVESGTVVDSHIVSLFCVCLLFFSNFCFCFQVEPTLDGMVLNSHFSQLVSVAGYFWVCL